MSKGAKRILAVIGTRPEAIKLAPVVKALSNLGSRVSLRVCVTAQHRQMLDQVLSLFSISPDWDLDLMQQGQDLTDITTRVLCGLRPILSEWDPHVVIVQGDTTSALAAALAAFYGKVGAVAHVEAGLRTGDRHSPWPEELNRKLITALSTLHFAPTDAAKRNLLAEGVPEEQIVVTGNTVIDALFEVLTITRNDAAVRAALNERFSFLRRDRRLLVVTTHRRENFGQGIERVMMAVRRLAARNDLEIVVPVHPNPNVRIATQCALEGISNVHLIEPLDYLPFVGLLDRAHVILTDSGGIQEEAPSLGKPVLVTREVTERPEAVEAGTVRVVGTDTGRIISETEKLLEFPEHYSAMARAHNPYGDGKAAGRIAARVALE